MIRQTQNNVQGYARASLWIILGFLLMLGSCTVPGGNQKISKIRLSVQNTLPIHRKNVPIVLTAEQLRKVNRDFSFKAYSVVAGKAPRETMLPSQADDLDYDGERDRLSFLLDLEPDETKELSILYDANVKAELTLVLNKQTRAGIFPELGAVAAMESNRIAYVLKPDGAIVAYGKKRAELFSVDPVFQSELDYEHPLSPEFRLHFESNDITLGQQIEISVEKPEEQWVLTDLENRQPYFVRKSEEQLNFSKSIGLSLNALARLKSAPTGDGNLVALTPWDGLIGCGGFALWDKAKSELIPIPAEGDYVRILANGAIRSIVQRIFPNLQFNGETFQLTSTVFIYGDLPWLEHHIYVKGLPTDYAIVTGIPNLGSAADSNEKQGWLWSWGTDPAGLAPLGVALIYPTTEGDNSVSEEGPLLSLTLEPDAEGRFSYRAFAIWGGGTDGIETETEFAQHVQITATAMETPPKIKFLPPEEK